LKYTGIYTILILFGIMLAGGIFGKSEVRKHIPHRIMDSIVAVERSSGVVIHSEKEYSLVLTAYHVIAKKVDECGVVRDPDNPISVSFVYFVINADESVEVVLEDLLIDNVIVKAEDDLALIKILTSLKIAYQPIAMKDPRLGEDVYLGGNPNQNYRVITKGIVSSKDRYIYGRGWMWQLSGGTVYGISGGGAFNMDGELIGVARAVDVLPKNICIHGECMSIPIEYIGYFAPRSKVKEFLFSTEFCGDFEYLER